MFKILQESLEYLNYQRIFKRNFYINKLKKLLKQDNIIVLQGQRRVGKSSILISFLQDLKKREIFYLNKELDIYGEINDYKDLASCFDYFVENYGDPKFIVIDEIQDIIGWEKFIRKLFALKKYKIFITGSNSNLLSGELATFLTGRYISFEIFPFSYDEFLEIKGLANNNNSFFQYLKIGGMPETILIEDELIRKNYLKNLLNSIILKDIVSRFKVKNVDLLEKIFKFLADNVGSLVSITNIYGFLKSIFKKDISLKTIATYLKYLQIVFLINETTRYDLKGKKILEYISKYYFTDIGIRNIFGFVFSKDIGKILENVVYIHLKRLGYEVFVGELGGKEIDFVAEKSGEKIYIQVSYLLNNENVIEREFKNLLKIKDNYPKIVLSLDEVFGNTYEGIRHINLKEFLIKDDILLGLI